MISHSEWRILLKEAAGELTAAGIEQAHAEATRLWCAVSGQDLSQWVLNSGPISPNLIKEYRDAVRRRARHEPFHYIVGVREFMGLNFHVDSRVLIPRPETEHLVERLLADVPQKPLIIVDVGTGSGAIAVCLVHFGWSGWRVIATDVSEEALAVAQLNAKNLLKRGHIDFVHGDLLTGILEPIDIVVANLPYVTEEDGEDCSPELSYEPRMALYAPEDGLQTIARLIEQMPSRLKPGGRVYLEVGIGQSDWVEKKLMAQGLTVLPRTRDLAGIDRVVAARNHAATGEFS